MWAKKRSQDQPAHDQTEADFSRQSEADPFSSLMGVPVIHIMELIHSDPYFLSSRRCWKKSSPAISAAVDGQGNGIKDRHFHSTGVQDLQCQPDLLPLCCQAQCEEHEDCGLAASSDGQPSQLRFRVVLSVPALRCVTFQADIN